MSMAGRSGGSAHRLRTGPRRTVSSAVAAERPRTAWAHPSPRMGQRASVRPSHAFPCRLADAFRPAKRRGACFGDHALPRAWQPAPTTGLRSNRGPESLARWGKYDLLLGAEVLCSKTKTIVSGW